MRCFSRILIAVCFVGLALSSEAQQKKMSFEQAFRGAPSNISRPLPNITGWADDDHYIEMKRAKAGGKPEYFRVNAKTGKSTPYTQTKKDIETPSASALGLKDVKNITLSPDGKWVAYTKNNDLYTMELSSKKETRITTDGSELILNGYASWIYFEEILGRASRYRAFWWSPDSRQLAFMRFDDSRVPVFPIYVADGQRGSLENTRYPKPGDPNPKVLIGITSPIAPTTIWADFDPEYDQYFGTPEFTPAGDLWIPWMNRNQDTLTVFQVDTRTGKKKEIYTETQKTWIDLDDKARFHFLGSNQGFILKSDKDGWENLYLHDMTGKEINPITKGNFWGTSIVKIDEKARQIYFRARKENSARYDFYRIGFDGKGETRLSFGDYSHDQVWLSPNSKYFITAFSNLSTPTTLVVADTKGKIIREIANSKGSEFNNYALPRTELVRVKSLDAIFELPVTITYPADFDSTKKYPVMVRIYGGPNAGTVYDRWSNPSGPVMWWAQEGVIGVSIDNRASGHFGKNGINYIYRQLGIYEIEDYMAAAKYIRGLSWADTTKIAITGGSFGGYMTCMALTYGADYFTHGIANASVTDWSLYDTHYTERFMDTPGDNPEGYRITSVMNYVDKYKGLLRIVHGTTDDNVHMQNSIQLINKLQDAGKHFEFMVYPNERHGIGANMATKALHNRNETYKFMYNHLLNKPMPKEFWEKQRAF